MHKNITDESPDLNALLLCNEKYSKKKIWKILQIKRLFYFETVRKNKKYILYTRAVRYGIGLPKIKKCITVILI